jgi:pilus assembly protein FimV
VTVINRLKESSVRNLTKTLALVSLLAPASGYSLGIGDIKLHSALNQNLDAEISLVVSAGDKASDVKVNLAPPDKFDEAGIPWTSFLSKIKFETIAGANGSVIIKLSSREAVKEPFLDFLLQVNWPKGSLYREFTVLLDPPAAYKLLPNSENYKTEQAIVPQYEPTQKQQTSVQRSISGADEYGPTTKNDTLWKAAEQASWQAHVSVEQMMIAMYEQNPHAFYKENVNALLTGKILKIPEREIVLKLSRKQALAEFNRQTQAWQNRLEPAPVATASTKKETPDQQLTLVAPTEAEVGKGEALVSENEQVTAKNKVDDAASKTIDKEVASVVSPVNDALKDKVVELEKQLAIMQQILVLKDQQLAALQNQPRSTPVVQAKPVQTTPGQTEVINPITQQPAQPVTKPIIPSEPEPASSTIYYLWGGVGAVILSLLGWLWWRKRKLDVNSQSLFASLSMSEASESKGFFSTSLEKDSAKNADAGGKNSFFSDFNSGDFDTFDTDQGEIDPVSEVDLYLAYGRYQQAEELMRDVLKDQPNRDECKLKLLKIFYSSENKQAFETYANELAKAGKKDDVEFWLKVTEMGSEICKDSTLFSPQVGEFSSKENTISEQKKVKLAEFDEIENNEAADIKGNNFSLSSFGESFNDNDEAAKEFPQTTDSLVDFDLISVGDEVIDEQQNNKSIDFDLSNIASKIEESSRALMSVVSKTPDVQANDKFESIDFDSNETKVREIDEIDTSVEKGPVENSQVIDSPTDKTSSLNSTVANNSLDRNFYVDKLVSGLNGEDFDQQGGLDVFDLTDMDELETKLDLAKAYIDMSDTDAAKNMASEVLEKGTAEQKKVAQALLNDLK